MEGPRDRACCGSPASPAGATARLALRVLRSLAGPLQAVLLALLHPGVTGQQACLLEGRPEVWVVLDECAGNAMRDGPGLTAGAAADHLDADVELALGAGDAQRREGCHLQDPATQVCERFLVIDQDAAFAGLDAHARNRVLATAGSPEKGVSQV